MDIKWKNKKVLFVILLIFSFGCSLFIANISLGRDLWKRDYFETNRFYQEYNQYLDQLNAYELADVNLDDLKKQITVSNEEIENHRYEYGDLSQQVTNLKEQYAPRIDAAKADGNPEVAEILTKERDAKIKDITLNFTSDDHVRQKIIAQKEKSLEEAYADYKEERNRFKQDNNVFQYYLVDTDTGEIHTSLTGKEAEAYRNVFKDKNMCFFEEYGGENHSALEIKDGAIASYLSLDEEYFPEQSVYQYNAVYSDEIAQQSSHNSTFKGYIGIPEDAPDSQQIIANTNYYKNAQLFHIACLLIGIIAIAGSIFALKRRGFREILSYQWSWYIRIPFDVRLVLLAGTLLFTMGVIRSASDFWNYAEFVRHLVSNVLLGLFVLITLALLQIIFCINSLRERGLEAEVRSSLLVRMLQSIRDAFLNRSIGMQLLMLLVIVPGIGLAAGVFFLLLNADSVMIVMVFGFIVLLVGIPVLFIIFKHAGYLNRIMKAVHAIAQGESEPDIQIRGKSALADLAKDVNALKQGVRTSQREQVKSERLKTELITNVSHDLRTPLTSIITYTDLLKSMDVSEEDRRSYIEIIDRKSKRLKVLIDDLFEASKMATGNIELLKSKVEIVQLLQQTLAEHNEEISSSSLQFKVTHDDRPIEAVVDGQKLHRVFDNLILNILKYSMPNTRVYIAVRNKQDEVEISFKNISEFELGGNIDELFERFKRGDQSRHTEGSGLGLAIAKSIIDLHDGELDIDVDGDLFKVIIKLKK